MGNLAVTSSLGKDGFGKSKLPPEARAERVMLHARKLHYGFPSLADIVKHWKDTYNVDISPITERDFTRNNHDEILTKIEECITSGEFEGKVSTKSMLMPIKRDGSGNNYALGRINRMVNSSMPLLAPDIMKKGNDEDRRRQMENLKFVSGLIKIQQDITSGIRDNIRLVSELEGVKPARLSSLVNRAKTKKELEEAKARDGFSKSKVDIADAEISDDMRIEEVDEDVNE